MTIEQMLGNMNAAAIKNPLQKNTKLVKRYTRHS